MMVYVFSEEHGYYCLIRYSSDRHDNDTFSQVFTEFKN